MTSKFKEKYQENFLKYREKIWAKKRARVRLHVSFRRSYREDYDRDLKIPGLTSHAFRTFRFLFKNWKLFGSLLFLTTLFIIFFVGLMSEETYTETQEMVDTAAADLSIGNVGTFAKSGLLLLSTIASAGLSASMTEVQRVFLVLAFLVVWLVTIYLTRHLLNGEKPKLRDGLYNSLTPLLSTLVVFFVAMVQAIPIFIVALTYSAAVATDFLATPFYALVYFIFAAAMLLLSAYLLSSTFIALIAVTAPGLYPMTALHAASDLVAGRRTRFVIRLIYLIFIIALIAVVIMLPIIFLDLWLKSWVSWLEGIPIVALFLFMTICFIFIYATTYLYLFYRSVLDYDYKK